MASWNDKRIPVLYLAPWVDVGGSDKGTVDWFRFLDRDRFRPSLITTQPSANRRLREIVPYADEVWDLPEMMEGDGFARFIVTFIRARRIKLVHIMNSRLAFELLPEIANLPDRPAVVVQLHVEEADLSGYVRYVTTRYGTLVDAFSVSSQALSDRLGEYEVPRAKRRLIRTGVDAEREFSPAHVKPEDGLERDCFHVLYPARLTAQKDPLLMVEAAAKLRQGGLDFQIHALGDGELMPAVRERVNALDLNENVILHGDRTDVAGWYAACDAVLLTSQFEGLPYVAYEAMAMATPLVGPMLPGLSELVTEETGILVAPRDGAEGYAQALVTLAADAALVRRMGQSGRARALAEFSLRRMTAEHEALYDELLDSEIAAADPAAVEPWESPWEAGSIPATGALRARKPGDTPLVSVIVPCFNHGRYLEECLQSITEQDYSPLEVIVVDDGSTDHETLEVLTRTERQGAFTVLRLAANRGPSAARNAALNFAKGRYVLPVDADNLLLPGAIAALVDQLGSADERIGFIYPNCQYFGNRTDYFEAPSYNLHALLRGNYCDTSSLLDRELLDRGFRYPEDVVLGHEDWDLVLSLAEQGIHGEVAQGKTLLYRKHGFTRSDLVDDAGQPFAKLVARRHPKLFHPPARARIKAEWNPAITLIAVDALDERIDDALSDIVANAARQSCQDFELVIRTESELAPTPLGRRLRRVPTALADSRAQALAQGVEISRGRWALASYGSLAELLDDPGLMEKVLRILATGANALAFADAGAELAPLRLLDPGRAREATLGALCWTTMGSTAPPPTLELGADDPLDVIARWLSGHARVQWRHLGRRHRGTIGDPDHGSGVRIGAPRLARARDAQIRRASPELPDGSAGMSKRLDPGTPWVPPQTRLLCRHYDIAARRYLFTNSTAPPVGCSLNYALGSVRGVPLAGTVSLAKSDGAESPFALGEPSDLDAPALLGFLEQAPLPMFEPVQLARLRTTGQYTLIAGDEDPLAGVVDVVKTIGFIEAYPILPRHAPHVDACYGLVGLVRTVDHAARRHRYGAGHVPQGQLSGELGALFESPVGDCEPVWIDADGTVSVAGFGRLDRRPSPIEAVRWAGDPLTWKGFSSPGPKLRGAARRAYDAARICAARPNGASETLGAPAGYLSKSGGGRDRALYGAVHPITGDQLLSTQETELLSLGYADVRLLGYLAASAPVTGALGTIRVGVPWAQRFGLVDGVR
jgi:glycosyltransferase involved in cell wall biosynthesis